MKWWFKGRNYFRRKYVLFYSNKMKKLHHPHHQGSYSFAIQKHRIRLKQVALTFIGVVLLYWTLTGLYSYLADECKGKLHTDIICDHYAKGVISGGLCSRLCDKKNVQLYYCLNKSSFQNTFLWGNQQIRVNNAHLDIKKHDHASETPFNNPQTGTSMEEFKIMSETFITTKLGKGDYKDLVTSVMNLADVNNDAKVSLAEAKTIWSLMQWSEFFNLLVFAKSDYVPNLVDFCGDMYSIQHLNNTYLYKKGDSGIFNWLFPNFHQWGFPYWQQRAKIAVGLLEFTLEAYQHNSGGSFYMCDISEANIGYADTFDVKISDVSTLMPREELSMFLKGVNHCSSDADCSYTPHCTTACDTVSHKCTEEIVKPNFQMICGILDTYITPKVPKSIKRDFKNLIHRCLNLSIYTNNMQLEHSLVLNEMKNLLWNQISYPKA